VSSVETVGAGQDEGDTSLSPPTEGDSTFSTSADQHVAGGNLFVTEAEVDVWVGVIDGGVGDEGRREWRLEA